MAHLYADGNYLIGSDGTTDYQFLAVNAQYTENSDTITVYDRFDKYNTMVIQVVDVTSLEDTSTGGSYYTLSGLQRFLRDNTGTGFEVANDLTHLIWSAGAITGFDLTDNGDGTIDLDAGTAYLRTSAVESSPLAYFSVLATAGVALTDNSLNYVFVDYNGGTPVVDVSTDVNDFNCLDKCILHLVQRVGTTLYFKNVIAQNVDGNRKLRRRFFESELIHRAQGIVIGNSNLKVQFSDGIVYFGLTKEITESFDATATDTFTYVYNNAGWVRVTGQTNINNTQYSTGTGLATLGNNKWKVDWLYLIPDAPTQDVFLVYGTAQYNSYQDAKLATAPSLPPELYGMGMLVGRYILQKSSTSPYAESAFCQLFASSEVPSLGDLADVDAAQPVTGSALVFDGSNWVDDATVIWTINLMDDLVSEDIYAGYDFSIDSVTNLVNSPTVTITLNGSAYTLTDPIVAGDKIVVTASVASVINLNITLA